MKKLTLLIVDDHHLFRRTLKDNLEKMRFFDSIVEADNGYSAIDICKTSSISLVLLDINMPGINGIETAQEILLIPVYKRPFIVMLSMYSETAIVLHMLKIGVQGYLLKNCEPEVLQKALRVVLNGDLYFPGEFDNNIKLLLSKGTPVYKRLTPEEFTLTKLLSEGKINKEIAQIMNFSVRTIESKRIRLEKKLGVRNTAELIKYAFRNGILSVS